MAVQLDFSGAEAQRLKITQEQQKYIRDLYKQASAEVGKLAEKAPRVPSDALRKQYLKTLQGQIDKQLKDIENQLNGTIRSGMTDTVKATVADAKTFLKENGLPIKGAYSRVPADIVQAVASGQLYTGNWTLSKALWLNTAETQRDVQSVIAQGIIQNRSAYDIAKDLEKYVDPTARKDWDWGKVYPGTKKVVDYNAQRLARTMVSHAYQQAFVRTTQKNPFVTKYRWEAANTERVCEICEERDGKLFDKDDLPLDHPNGMCTFTAVMEDLDKIGERLGDWAAGKEDPELDKWAEDLYGKGWEKKKEEAKPKQKRSSGQKALTPQQEQKAKEWDAQYANVAAWAKETGRDVDKTVRSILGKPPVGSVHYQSAAASTTKAAVKTTTTPKSSFRASDATDMNRRDANAYIKAMASRQGYSTATRRAMDDYMMFSDDMNAYLRGIIRENDYGSSINILHSAMSTGTQEIVYRGCNSGTLGINAALSESDIQKRLVGSVFRDKGFLSTSKTSDVAREFSTRGTEFDNSKMPTIMTILVPSGANRAYIDSGLGEVLLDKGSRMEITEASIQDGILHVTASVIS